MAWNRTKKASTDHLTCSERILRVNRRNLVHTSKLKQAVDDYDRQCSRRVSKISSEIYRIYIGEQLPREREMVERGLLEMRSRHIPVRNGGRRLGIGGSEEDLTVERLAKEFENTLRKNSLPVGALEHELRALLASDVDAVVKASEAYDLPPVAERKPSVASSRKSSVPSSRRSSFSEVSLPGEKRASVFLPAVTLRRPSYGAVAEEEEPKFMGEWRPPAFRMRTPGILHADWVREKSRREKRAEQSQQSYEQLIRRLAARNEEEIEKLYTDDQSL